MKFLKIKYIVPLLIIISAGIIAGLYFIGALEINALDSNNIEFSEEGFIDFNTIQYNENGMAYEPVINFNKQKLIGENDDYYLFFDESTTVAKIVSKLTATAEGYTDADVVYATANDKFTTAVGANLIIDYASKSSGKSLTTQLNTMSNSVKYNNPLTGKNEGHYKVKYLPDGGVQILYEVGRFSAGIDYLPKHFAVADFAAETTENFNGSRSAFDFNRTTLLGRFRGNTLFQYKYEIVRDENNKPTHFTPVFLDEVITYSPAVVDYVNEHQLAATVVQQGTSWKMTGIADEFVNGYGTHINTPDSPVTSNPFYYRSGYVRLFNPNIYREPYVELDEDVKKQIKFAYRDLAPSLSTSELSSFYNLLYVAHNQYEATEQLGWVEYPVLDDEGNPIIRGGFQAYDDNGNYLYDEDGKPVQRLYSLEQVAEDNAIFGAESITSLERFQIGLQIKLTDKGFESSIISESLKDADYGKIDSKYNHDYIFDKVTVFPQFTSVSSEEVPVLDEFGQPLKDKNNKEITQVIPSEGMIVIPDGSGAVIDFSTWARKSGYQDFGKTIYGADHAFVLRAQPELVEDVMFGMYGIMDFKKGRGIMAVAEKGAAQTSIFATVQKNQLGSHSAYFSAKLRQNENVRTGSGWNIAYFPKFSKTLTDSDIVYNYIFLFEEDMGYVGLANRYREYLIDLYNLEEKDNTRNNLVDLNFLGAFERYDLFLGVKYMKDDSLTTFAQAKEIIDELLTQNVDTLSAGYLSWTTDEMEREIRPTIKASPALGGTKGMQTLNKYLEDKGINFYPEFYVGTGKGYGYSFGNLKYTTRGVANSPAKQYPYNLATLQIDRSFNPTYYLSPSFYRSHIERMLPSYNKLGVNGAFLPDLGNLTVGNFKEKEEVYPGKGVLYQMDALDLLLSKKQNLKISSPFDYAMPYINLATDIPTEASFYGVFDYAIPFYQLVVNGLFDYTMEAVNGTSDKNSDWFLVKALETGSNLQFLISYEDPKILLETDYTMYYKAYYQNWKDEIVEMNNTINEIGIHKGRLVGHEVLPSGLIKVTYQIPGQDDLVLLLNTSNVVITDGGQTYNRYSYKIVGGGI